jgi:hypothetical protein|uniref:Ycf36 n=1 Tax=Ochromonas sp. CCMP1393 TaxID=420556 RepID=A0A0D3MKA2_9STRA|nr:hypothetical protein YCF36 [Ochromonas sp. CCMP1393]AIM52809.1 hypothetical protein YCF36 [Ochromonas sp. CCMP1393]
MVPNIKIFLLCPIPEDQKPINEYIDLKENPLFNWTALENEKYKQKLVGLYSFFWLIISIFEGNLWSKNTLKVFILTLEISSICVLFSLLFIFIRWRDIKKRFTEARLFYEEASWFDGQIWEKPFFLIKNDKLICSQKIQPILQRLIREIANFSFLSLFLFVCFEFT